MASPSLSFSPRSSDGRSSSLSSSLVRTSSRKYSTKARCHSTTSRKIHRTSILDIVQRETRRLEQALARTQAADIAMDSRGDRQLQAERSRSHLGAAEIRKGRLKLTTGPTSHYCQKRHLVFSVQARHNIFKMFTQKDPSPDADFLPGRTEENTRNVVAHWF